jgi:cytochrome c553
MTRRREFHLLWIVLPFLALASSAASAQSLPDRLRTILVSPSATANATEGGRKISQFCANCHGLDGNSKMTEVPNLAGQNPVYLLEQVRKFSAGERRDEWMEPMIKQLSEAERLNVVVFYSAMTVVPASSKPGPAAGQDLFGTKCVKCHGPQARGGERFPRLAGQQHQYIVRSLTRYRNQTGERIAPEMFAMTAALKDSDIQALADFLSGLK